MNIFLSSVIAGFEPYREAAAAAITMLGHTVVRSEDFAASPDSPELACLAGIRESDAVLVLLGGRYGAIQASGLSATHEEFREARTSKPTLVFVQSGVNPEPAQATLIQEARDWAHGALAPSFAPETLTGLVVRGLHDLELATVSGPLDQDEMAARAVALLPDERHAAATSLAVVMVGGPRQSVLRPTQLEDEAFGRELVHDLLFGAAPLFDPRDGTAPAMSGSSLVVRQLSSWFALDAEGTVVVVRPIHREKTRDVGMQAVIEEAVRDDIAQVLTFADLVLERIDRTRRLTHVVPVVALVGASYGSWRTRSEHAASPNSMTMNIRKERPLARLSPPARPRQALRYRTTDLAEDLTVLLRRAATS